MENLNTEGHYKMIPIKKVVHYHPSLKQHLTMCEPHLMEEFKRESEEMAQQAFESELKQTNELRRNSGPFGGFLIPTPKKHTHSEEYWNGFRDGYHKVANICEHFFVGTEFTPEETKEIITFLAEHKVLLSTTHTGGITMTKYDDSRHEPQEYLEYKLEFEYEER